MSFTRHLMCRQLAPYALLACLLLLLSGCSPETTPSETPVKVVDTYVIHNGAPTPFTRLSGRVAAAEKTTLSFEVPGKIEALSIDVGETFAAGESLARLGEERYRLVLDQRQAEQREATTMLQEKQRDYQRHAELAEKGYVSRSLLDTVRASLDSARSRQQSATAALELAQRDLKLTTLTAPFDGSVSQRLGEPSERVGANQPVLEVISDRMGFDVEGSVPETLIESLVVGSRHTVILPALGDTELEATLRQLGSQPRSSNDYPLILHLESPPPEVRSGMTAEIQLTLPIARNTAGVTLPMTALVHGAGDHREVLRVRDDMTLETVPVEVVTLGERRAHVTGELSPGDRIVARGTEFVRPGQSVSLLGQGPQRFH